MVSMHPRDPAGPATTMEPALPSTPVVSPPPMNCPPPGLLEPSGRALLILQNEAWAPQVVPSDSKEEPAAHPARCPLGPLPAPLPSLTPVGLWRLL